MVFILTKSRKRLRLHRIFGSTTSQKNDSQRACPDGESFTELAIISVLVILLAVVDLRRDVNTRCDILGKSEVYLFELEVKLKHTLRPVSTSYTSFH